MEAKEVTILIEEVFALDKQEATPENEAAKVAVLKSKYEGDFELVKTEAEEFYMYIPVLLLPVRTG